MRRLLSIVAGALLLAAGPALAQTGPDNSTPWFKSVRGDMSGATVLQPGTLSPQSLAALLAGSLTAAEFNAKCSGDGTDDSPAFQNMVNQAAITGQAMFYSGKCYLPETLKVTTAPGGLISLSPLNSLAELDTNGEDLITAVPPLGTSASILYGFDLESNAVHNLSGTSINTGTLLHLDCTTYANFCTTGRSKIVSNHLFDMAGAFFGSEVSGFDIDKNVSQHKVTTGAENFVEVHGDVANGVQNCSSAVFTDDNYVIGGSFEYLNGCVQGFINRDDNLLLGFFGVFSNAPVGVQDIKNHGNYFEAGAEGIFLPLVDGTTNTDNTFDPNPNSNGGMSANWSAIVVGGLGAGPPAQAVVVSHNSVFNFSGQLVNTPIVVNAGNGSTVDHNTVTGLINTAHCMLVGTNVGTGYAAPILGMDHNQCWAAGDMISLGTAPQASQNQYTVSPNYSVPVLYENGASTPSSLTTPGNVAGLNVFGSGAAFIPQYLPRTPGTPIVLGDSGGATVTSSLSATVNLVAHSGAFAPLYGPLIAGSQIALGDSGGVTFPGAIGNSTAPLVIDSSFLQMVNGPVLVPYVRYIGFPNPVAPTAACATGSDGVGAIGVSIVRSYCAASGDWRWAPMSAGVPGSTFNWPGSLFVSGMLVDGSPSGVAVTQHPASVAADNTSGNLLACSPTATIPTASQVLPPNPHPFQTFHLASECTISQVTVTGGTSTSGTTPAVIGAPAGLTNTAPVTFTYDASNLVWARW